MRKKIVPERNAAHQGAPEPNRGAVRRTAEELKRGHPRETTVKIHQFKIK